MQCFMYLKADAQDLRLVIELRASEVYGRQFLLIIFVPRPKLLLRVKIATQNVARKYVPFCQQQ